MSQELFIKQKDSSVILMADKNQIKSFELNTGTAHFFVASALYNFPEKGVFFEVLTKSDKGLALLRKTKTKFVKGDERDIEKQRLGEIYDSFDDAVTYYFSLSSGPLHLIDLREKGLKKAIGEKNNKAEIYFAAHKNEYIDEEFLKSLLNLSINKLKKKGASKMNPFL